MRCSARTWLSRACWVFMSPFPFLHLRLLVPAARSRNVVAGQLRMVLRGAFGIRHVPYAAAWLLPIFGR